MTVDAKSPAEKEFTTYEGRQYEVIKEGLAEILDSQTSPEANDTKAQTQAVFYNPIQQFNRDLSLLAVRAFAEDLSIIRQLKQRQQQRKKHGTNNSKKRKRGGEEEDSEAVQARVRPIEDVAEPAEQYAGGEETPILSNQNAETGDKKHGRRESGNPTEEVTNTNSMNGVPTAPKADRDKLNGKDAGPRKPENKPPFRILDALSATGLRALRYAKEVPTATCIIANDISPSATKSIKLNVQHNGLENLIQTNTGDALAHMYESASPSRPADQRLYQVIDLDPYGTAAPLFDAAVRALVDGGLLCVTCTDAGVFASTGYPEKTFSQYGGLPFKGPQSHEGGLRLILHAIATSAARHGIAIEPLLSLSIDFYARVFVRIRKSPAEVKFLAGKTMVVYNCDEGCGSWNTQLMAQTKQKKAKNADVFYKFSLAQGPTACQTCEHCGFKMHLSGPMWGGPLHNPYFIQKLLDLLPRLDKEVYGTIPRMEGMLTLAMNEAILDPTHLPNSMSKSLQASSPDAENSSPQQSNPSPEALAEPFPSLPPFLPSHHPFFLFPSSLAKVLHCVAPSDAAFRGALLHLGYRTSRSHTKPGSIVTDAPFGVIWEIMREWVRQKAPVKEGSLRERSAGAEIMYKARSRKALERVKEDFKKVLEERSEDVEELKTKVEALLYRMGKMEANSNTELQGGSCEVKVESAERKSSDETTNGTETSPGRPDSKEPHVKNDTSTLDVNFDEGLGRERVGKRLVRYQINPRADWGPMTKASG
ncbi:MAG: hypothetical protein Q9191_001662 [Dirinaria sp. TL-2023a]